jgi:hypothetical protein
VGVVPRIFIGRTQEVKQANVGEMATSGLIAEMTPVETGDHEHLADLFFRAYQYGKMEIPAPGVFHA